MLKKILIAGLVLALIGGAVAYYMYNKPHQDMELAKPALSVDAVSLFNDYDTDEAAANEKYLGKIIAISGKVKERSMGEDGSTKVILETEGMFGVSCSLDPLTEHERTDFSAGETVTFKGTCAGFNLDVQVDRCVEIK
ncbi:MAG: hypothetical protein R2792_05295 [Saprospiraceae bacterium]